jgi:hypothetical protein
MPRKVKVVALNNDTTYADITDAVVENVKAETKQMKHNKREGSVNLNRCQNPKQGPNVYQNIRLLKEPNRLLTRKLSQFHPQKA